MKIKNIILCAAFLAATAPVLAQNTEYVPPDAGFHSTKTRAQVQAELNQAEEQARMAGHTLHDRDWNYPQLAIKPARTRASVQAELSDARSKGQSVLEQTWNYPIVTSDASAGGGNVKTAMSGKPMTPMRCC
jgi:hypothetical protein